LAWAALALVHINVAVAISRGDETIDTLTLILIVSIDTCSTVETRQAQALVYSTVAVAVR
jgi:hypothetical protein